MEVILHCRDTRVINHCGGSQFKGFMVGSRISITPDPASLEFTVKSFTSVTVSELVEQLMIALEPQ